MSTKAIHSIVRAVAEDDPITDAAPGYRCHWCKAHLRSDQNESEIVHGSDCLWVRACAVLEAAALADEKRKAKALKYSRKYRAANREKERAQKRAKYAANREKERESRRSRRAADAEKAREKVRRWRAANREKEKARARERYAENPEKTLRQQRDRNAAKAIALLAMAVTEIDRRQ